MIERALMSDLDAILALMRQLSAYERLTFDLDKARAAMSELLAVQELGAVWVLRDETRLLGYLALCLGFSLGAGGRDAFIDEIFVAEPFRNRGWGTKMIETAIRAAREAGVVAVHLGVQHTNANAMRLYRRLGLEPLRATILKPAN
jgi:ribosomal protein S18 acetylase RimI-like enzyme